MRCSYCGGLNGDQAQVCIRCGRDLSAKTPPAQTPASRQRSPSPPPQPQQPYYQPPNPNQRPPAPGYPRPTPPAQQPQRVPPATGQRVTTPPVGQRAPVPPTPAVPEAPATFPPRTMDHLNALEQGALAYSIVEDTENVGRKRIVHILYPRCAPWQQMATLLKAFKEQRADKFDTIIIQGSYAQERTVYGFSNGQLQFDRNVRLGSRIMNRYQIETGNGFEVDAIRVVLSE